MKPILTLALLLAIPGLAVRADVDMASPFSDHMVLQRGMAVPIWGTADPGERITVEFAGQTKTAEADAGGAWKVALDPLEAGGKGQTLKVSGKNTLLLKDVLVGEVWICSGQSNMEWPVSATLNAKEELSRANFPEIRLFNVPGHTISPFQLDACPGKWEACSEGSARGFSAVGYFFGKRLFEELGVPIGLMGSNWGGTRIEPWISPAGFRLVPELKKLADAAEASDPATPAGKALWEKYVARVEEWVPTAKSALGASRPLPALPSPLDFRRLGNGSPTAIYNAMIHPLAPFAMRGAIWYQGESNGGEGISYHHKKLALIRGWRKLFNPDLAFYWVQLANFQNPNDKPQGGDGWARIREAQRKSLEEPHTGMAVIIDIGEARDIHPRNKQDVGARLACWALHQTYAKKEIVPSGPLYKSHRVEEGAIRISFDHVGSGLMVGAKQGILPTEEVKDGELARFAVAGEDRKWRWAKAVIDVDSVIVRSPEVSKPVAVRYAFSMNPEGANLYNREGLPASPFRTDDW